MKKIKEKDIFYFLEPIIETSLDDIEMVNGKVLYSEEKAIYDDNIYGYFHCKRDFILFKSISNVILKSLKLNRKNLKFMGFDFYNYKPEIIKIKNEYGLIGYELNISNFKSCLKENCRDILERCKKYLYGVRERPCIDRPSLYYEDIGTYIPNLSTYPLFYDYSDNRYRNRFELNAQLSYIESTNMIISGIYRIK